MTRNQIRITLQSGFALVAALIASRPVAAQDAKQPYPNMAPIEQYLMDRDAEIGFLGAPRVAIGAVKLQPVTSGRWTVTAEVASSSLVVPAIHSHKRAKPISSKPTMTRKGRIWRPLCVLFALFRKPFFITI
jgi:hypothetical protein